MLACRYHCKQSLNYSDGIKNVEVLIISYLMPNPSTRLLRMAQEEIGHTYNQNTTSTTFVGLKTFAKDNTCTRSRVLCDNTTAFNIVNHMGTSHSETWEWCIDRAMWLSVAHMQGKQNLMADFESLSYVLGKVNFRHDIDLFASRINYQFPKFVSFRPDLSAYATDALGYSGLSFMHFHLSVLFQVY